MLSNEDQKLYQLLRSIGSWILGANATIRDHVSIAEANVIGMQAGVVAALTEPGQVSVGVPCRALSSVRASHKDKTRRDNNVAPPAIATAASADGVQYGLTAADRLTWCTHKRFHPERFHRYLQPSLAKGHLTNDGPLQRVVAQKIKSFCGSKRCVLMTTSGSAALHVLASAWEMKRQKRLRWATQSFTFPSSIQGPLCDAIVVDHDPQHAGPSLLDLEQIQDQIDGVVVTNVFGQPADCLVYEQWCRAHGKLLLLDNAATALHFVTDGDQENQRCIHDIGDGAFISLHETKPMGRGEGGAVFVAPELQLHVHRAMNFGFDIYSNERIAHRYASNWRMSDFAAGAICDHIDTVVEEDWMQQYQGLVTFAAEELAAKYHPAIQFYRTIQFPTILPCLFLVIPNATCNLDLVANYLQRCIPSIEAKRYYRPLESPEKTPLAWEHFNKSICLPLHVGITKEMISYQLDQLSYAVMSLFV